MTGAEINAKFQANAARAIPLYQARRLAELVGDLDHAKNITALGQATTVAPERLQAPPTPS